MAKINLKNMKKKSATPAKSEKAKKSPEAKKETKVTTAKKKGGIEAMKSKKLKKGAKSNQKAETVFSKDKGPEGKKRSEYEQALALGLEAYGPVNDSEGSWYVLAYRELNADGEENLTEIFYGEDVKYITTLGKTLFKALRSNMKYLNEKAIKKARTDWEIEQEEAEEKTPVKAKKALKKAA